MQVVVDEDESNKDKNKTKADTHSHRSLCDEEAPEPTPPAMTPMTCPTCPTCPTTAWLQAGGVGPVPVVPQCPHARMLQSKVMRQQLRLRELYSMNATPMPTPPAAILRDKFSYDEVKHREPIRLTLRRNAEAHYKKQFPTPPSLHPLIMEQILQLRNRASSRKHHQDPTAPRCSRRRTTTNFDSFLITRR